MIDKPRPMMTTSSLTMPSPNTTLPLLPQWEVALQTGTSDPIFSAPATPVEEPSMFLSRELISAEFQQSYMHQPQLLNHNSQGDNWNLNQPSIFPIYNASASKKRKGSSFRAQGIKGTMFLNFGLNGHRRLRSYGSIFDDPKSIWSLTNPINARLVDIIQETRRFRCLSIDPLNPSGLTCNHDYKEFRSWARHLSKHGGQEQQLVDFGLLAPSDVVAQASPWCEQQRADCACGWSIKSWSRVENIKRAHMIKHHREILIQQPKETKNN